METPGQTAVGNGMNHPPPEEWVEWLYQELSPEKQAQLDRHLQGCLTCRERVAAWRQVGRELEQWKITPRQRQAWTTGFQRIAAAALLAGVLSVGFVAGKATGPSLQELEGSIRLAVEEELAQRGLGEERPAASSLHPETELADLRAQIRSLQATQLLQFRQFRQELETVAFFTEQGLNGTQAQLLKLASHAAPSHQTE